MEKNFMCISVNLSNKNYLKNQTSLSKEEKNNCIAALTEKIMQLANKKGPYPYPFGKCQQDRERLKEVVRCKPRIGKKDVSLQLECYFFDRYSSSISNAILRFEEKEYWLSYEEANEVAALMLGNIKEPKSPSLFSLLNGNRLERIKVIKGWALNVSEFDEWETQKKIYRERIYPKCFSVMEKLLPKNSIVLELCGGDGEFAKFIFEKKSAEMGQYVLVDLNKKSIQKAETNLRSQITQSKAFPICDDVTTVDFGKTLKEKKADFVVAIGGLTEQVLSSKKAALQALGSATSYLKEGGFVLLTGLMSSWIISEDLEKLGFEILNCISCSDNIFQDSAEFYLAKKVSEKENSSSLWNFPSPDLTTVEPRGIEH